MGLNKQRPRSKILEWVILFLDSQAFPYVGSSKGRYADVAANFQGVGICHLDGATVGAAVQWVVNRALGPFVVFLIDKVFEHSVTLEGNLLEGGIRVVFVGFGEACVGVVGFFEPNNFAVVFDADFFDFDPGAAVAGFPNA